LKKHSNSGKKSEPTTKRAKSRGPVQRDTKEVLAELVGKLKEKLDPKKAVATSAGDGHPRGDLRPNLDRLTLGVDLGDQWSHYCILGLEGETLAEGQLRTTQEDFATFFQGLNAARVVIEAGTHSAWVQEVIRGCGHEVLDECSLSNYTFELGNVLMGHALSEEAPAPGLQRGRAADVGAPPQIAHRAEEAYGARGDLAGLSRRSK